MLIVRTWICRLCSSSYLRKKKVTTSDRKTSSVQILQTSWTPEITVFSHAIGKVPDLLAYVAVHCFYIHAHTVMQAVSVMWWGASWVTISDHMVAIFPRDRGWGRAWKSQRRDFYFEFLWTAYGVSSRGHKAHLPKQALGRPPRSPALLSLDLGYQI